MSISYFGSYVPLLRILDVNKLNSIQNYPCTHHEGRGRTILFHTFFTFALHRVTVHHQAPTTLIPSTHRLGSCEHSRANLEAFKRETNFYQTTIPYIFSPWQKSPH